MSEDKQITIDRIDIGTGWVNHNFYTWLERNPEFKVRAVLPIVENSNTVAIHVWFD